MQKALGFIVLLALVLQPWSGALQLAAAHDPIFHEDSHLAVQQDDLVEGWPMPTVPIPHHEPGHISTAAGYTTEVQAVGEQGTLETLQLTGLDALAAQGIDPLAGNYTLAPMDKFLRSTVYPATMSPGGTNDNFALQTLNIVTTTLAPLDNSLSYFGNYQSNDIAVGDLNNDGQMEQTAAWLDGGTPMTVNISTGGMPGAFAKTTSAPAVVAAGTAASSGTALRFDGTDDYIEVPNTTSLNPAQITLAVWAKSDDAEWANYGFLISKRNAYILHPYPGTRNIQLILYIGGWKYANFFAPPGFEITEWHHYAGTYDGKTLRLYVDGKLVDENAVTGSITSADTGSLFIGRDDGTAYYFDGLLDNVQIWNRALTQAEIEANMVFHSASPSGLVGSWLFEESTGATASDSSGYNNHGALTNGPEWEAHSFPVSEIDLFVRGSDGALWHCSYAASTGCFHWEAGGGGVLLSAPAVVATGPGEFDVYAVLAKDNQIYRRSWRLSAGGWSSNWQKVGDSITWQKLASMSPVPELPAPAVVKRGDQIDIFRLAPDNTLRWLHYTGSVWQAWQNLGGMLASAPAVLSADADNMLVFARGADNQVWIRSYSGGWSPNWLWVPNTGMPAGTAVGSSPAVVSPVWGQFDIYVRGTDNHLWKVHYTGGWGSWSDLGGDLASAPSVALVGAQPYPFAQTPSGGLQVYSSGVWQNLPQRMPACCTQIDTNLAAIRRSLEYFQDFSVDIETGYFWGDGRAQIVLGYHDPAPDGNTVRIALFDTSLAPDAKGFTPVKITEFTLGRPASYFRLTTGDFLDHDGIDDIAVVSIDTALTRYYVDIFRFNRNPLAPAFEKKASNDVLGSGNQDYTFSGTLSAAAGDFDRDGQDELVVSTSFIKVIENNIFCDKQYDYRFFMRIFDVDSIGSTYMLKRYMLEDAAANIKSNLDASRYAAAITLAAGDVNGDGKDEIVRTWPYKFNDSDDNCNPQAELFYRTAQVIVLPDNANPNINTWPITDGKLSATPTDIATKGPTRYSYGDRLAVGDYDRDLKGEIVWQAATGSVTPGHALYAYKLNTSGTYAEIASKPELWQFMPRLVSGDFTGEGLRVGPPSYRVQKAMNTPQVFLNMPPKHRDIILTPSGQVLIEVNQNAQAVYTAGNTIENSTSSESKRDWSLSIGLETAAGAAGHQVSASLDNTYGGDFSKSQTQISSVSFLNSTTADFDQVVFNSTSYAVWEYPVYGSQASTSGDAHTIVVVFPLVQKTDTPDTQQGSTCDENFYTPSHQQNNVWSYGPISGGYFADYNRLISESTSTGGTDITVGMSTATEILRRDSFHNQLNTGLEYSYENSLEIPLIGKAWDFSFRASVNGSFGLESISTLSSKFTNSTSVFVDLPTMNPTNLYNIKAILYWAKAGYMVVDYQTQPTNSSTWNLYNKPDPAFILPWYGFPDLNGVFPLPPHNDTPPCGFDKQLFTHDIQLSPAYIQNGETLNMAATVRNFSNVNLSNNLTVRFYLGAPGSGNSIGSCTIDGPGLDRDLGPKQCSTTWTVTGASGEERIYAFIDSGPTDEMHDENDVINNNIGYALLNVARADYFDPGLSQVQPYQGITHADASGLGYGIFFPTTNSTETIRYELVPAAAGNLRLVGSPIQLLVFQGGDAEPSLGYAVGPIPAVLEAFYRDQDLLPGMAEANLKLYRREGSQWVEATCPGFQIARMPASNRIAVPVCSAGTFILTDVPPSGIKLYMPVLIKK